MDPVGTERLDRLESTLTPMPLRSLAFWRRFVHLDLFILRNSKHRTSCVAFHLTLCRQVLIIFRTLSTDLLRYIPLFCSHNTKKRNTTINNIGIYTKANMFFARIPSTMNTLKTVGKTILTGSAFALTTTAFSCGLAIAIEGAAHKTLYYFKPEWYEGVTYAYGLPQLEHARHDAHHVSEVSGAVATSHEHEQEQSAIAEENEGLVVEDKLSWSNSDETVFTTAINVQKEVEQRRRQEEDEDKFTLATADKLVRHVLSTALTC